MCNRPLFEYDEDDCEECDGSGMDEHGFMCDECLGEGVIQDEY